MNICDNQFFSSTTTSTVICCKVMYLANGFANKSATVEVVLSNVIDARLSNTLTVLLIIQALALLRQFLCHRWHVLMAKSQGKHIVIDFLVFLSNNA
jgi:hypothetical protein